MQSNTRRYLNPGRKILPIALHLRKPKTEVRILNYITESFYFF